MRLSVHTCKLLAAAAFLAVVAACSPIYTDHGYAPPEELLDELVVGESGREDVLEVAGTPATMNDAYGESWFYIGSRFRQDGYRETEEVERRVVAISFDEEGTVSNVEQYGLRDGRTVAISRRVTETNVGRLTFIDQLLRGLGRIDPSRAFSR